jgi:GT2 family glycosyltransferase/glycosyltransferase involved in cell wall biosynthesis
MSWSLADARFLLQRASGLSRRGLLSLRTRGWRATWERVTAQFGVMSPKARRPLWFPDGHPTAPAAIFFDPAPRASIVIPVFNQLAHTLRCLRALAEHPPHAGCEVIVVDDGSTDGTPQALSAIAGLRYHRRAENGGFIAACNDGAGIAHGEYLVFLNNDTIPQPGWLDALLEPFASQPDTGLVGAQLRYPDGRLQEAGGVVFSDGNAWNYGRYGNPDDCRFAYLRDADYVSGAAIAIPYELFSSLGGFDPHYAPAYYEDTDLAFRVRASGKRVLYQPDAVVVHEEGTTSGTDVAGGVKAFQVRNRERFAQRHARTLAGFTDPSIRPSPASVHRTRRQILIIDALTPTPDHDSGSLRLVNLMRLLNHEGAHMVFLPAKRTHADEHTHVLQKLGVEVWHAPYAGRATNWLREHGPRFDTVMICRHYVAREFLPLVRRHAPQAQVVFDTIDLHYLREQRGAALAGDGALARAAARTRALELDIIARSDLTLVVSETECALLAQDAPQARVEVLSNLHQLAGEGLPYAQRQDLVFVGGFRHPPNVDAVRWFVEEVFPLVRAGEPGIRFHCIGGHVPAVVQALAAHDGVLVHGHVPDIEPYMRGCRIALAPLRYGAGVKGKINLSMAHGQPVVATSVAVEGMHLRDGHDVLVADNAEAFAAAVLRLYRDESLWQSLATHGQENVQRHFSMEAAAETVRRVFLAGTR